MRERRYINQLERESLVGLVGKQCDDLTVTWESQHLSHVLNHDVRSKQTNNDEDE